MEEILALNSENNFPAIADMILNKSLLVINAGDEFKFRISEIEFYLYNDNHKDTYVHRHQDQLLVNSWYFHKMGKSYRGGSFKGLDICFGAESYGGILIRSMHCMRSDRFIEGPCLCVNKILDAAGVTTIPDLVSIMNEGDASVTSGDILRLVPRDNIKNDPIYRSIRVGLNPERNPEFVNKPYRFVVNPEMIRKNKKNIIQ